jgi:hypothetical protein
VKGFKLDSFASYQHKSAVFMQPFLELELGPGFDHGLPIEASFIDQKGHLEKFALIG